MKNSTARILDSGGAVFHFYLFLRSTHNLLKSKTRKAKIITRIKAKTEDTSHHASWRNGKRRKRIGWLLCASVKANGQLDKTGDWLRVVMVVMAIVLRGLWKKLNTREAINCAGR